MVHKTEGLQWSSNQPEWFFGVYGFLGIWSRHKKDWGNSHDQKHRVTRKSTVIENCIVRQISKPNVWNEQIFFQTPPRTWYTYSVMIQLLQVFDPLYDPKLEKKTEAISTQKWSRSCQDLLDTSSVLSTFQTSCFVVKDWVADLASSGPKPSGRWYFCISVRRTVTIKCVWCEGRF